MTKLSKREQVLLIFLAAVAIFGFGIMYWIMPLMADIDALKMTKDDLEIQEIQMRTTIAQTDKLLENKDNLIDEVDDLMDHLSDPLVAEKFDDITRSLAKSRQITIHKLQYGGVEVVMPTAMERPIDTYEYNLKELLNTYLGFGGETVVQKETGHQILKQSVTLEVEGSYASVQRLLGDLSNVGLTYYVKDISYERITTQTMLPTSSPDEAVVYDEVTAENSTITVDVYFLNKEISDDLRPQK